MKNDPFKEYLIQTEPDKREKSYAWYTAIGLQEVDGLKPSDYLFDTAIKNIEGQISIDEAQKLLKDYYDNRPNNNLVDRTQEADIVSCRIAKILSENAFSFNPNEYISIHKKLFVGIYDHAGKMRDYNISKKEWVLNGATVTYGNAATLKETLRYDFKQEKEFDYKDLNIDGVIKHLARFISNLWQIHIFGEGNTRTTAVFFIKYLRTLGFNVTNDIFAKNAWYFRNALVRANYNDLKNGIYETTEYLELFLRNLLLEEKNELHNRELHISGLFKKADIESGYSTIKADIEDSGKIEYWTFDCSNLSNKTIEQINILHTLFGSTTIFGRSMVEEKTGLRSSRASVLIKTMLERDIIVPVSGKGKGKYIFK
ncbi:MAG: Fic family protein [Erysipelotrichaceae bacterium]|nr:Fic family protein [Erysipelotrichaceae bacterium]